MGSSQDPCAGGPLMVLTYSSTLETATYDISASSLVSEEARLEGGVAAVRDAGWMQHCSPAGPSEEEAPCCTGAQPLQCTGR